MAFVSSKPRLSHFWLFVPWCLEVAQSSKPKGQIYPLYILKRLIRVAISPRAMSAMENRYEVYDVCGASVDVDELLDSQYVFPYT